MAGKLAPKQIAQDSASDKQVLTWNNSTARWEPQLNPIALFLFGASNIATTTTTRFLWPSFENETAPTTAIQFRVPSACTLRSLRVRHNTGAGNGGNVVYTVRKNSVATALVVTMASTANDGSDLSNTVAFAAGDLLDIQVTKAAAIGTSPTNIMATLEAVA